MISAKAYYDQLFGEATAAHQSGDLAKAITLYKQLTRDIKGQSEPFHRLALVYTQKGQYQEAIPWFEKAISTNEKNPIYKNNFAETLQRLNVNDRAIDLLRSALSIEPGFVEAKQKLGVVLKKIGQFEESATLLKEVTKEQPNYAPAYFQLGTLMLETGNYKSAKTYLKTAVELDEKNTKAWNNLAIAHQEWKEYDLAIAYYEKTLEIDAGYEDGVRNSALIQEKVGHPDQAKDYWLRLAKLKENNPLILWKASTIEPIVYQSKDEIDRYREDVLAQLQLIKGKKIKIDSGQLTNIDVYPPAGLIYHGKDDLEIKKAYGELFAGIPKVSLPDKVNDKPHVGFVVTGGHEGVFVKCMRGIINNLSAEKFEVTIVCSFPNGEKIVKPNIENPDVKFVSLPKSLEQGVKYLAALNFDLLHYWEVGTDAYNYYIPFFKPARIQCTSWGWPTTSGIPTMDYFISSKGLDEPSSQKDYSEELVLFDKLPSYYYPPEIPELNKTKSDFGIDEEAHLYLCIQNVKKVHPDFDEVVKGILEKDPQAQVVLLGDKQAVISAAVEQRIKRTCDVHTDRVQLIERQEKEGYFNILNLADVVLDTLYYNGGANTNGDAFALNKPVVTLPVDFHRGRYTAAVYGQMGFDDLVADSSEDYVKKAVRVATDQKFNLSVIEKIEENKHKFFEDKEAVLELENFIMTVTNKSVPNSSVAKIKEQVAYDQNEDSNSALAWLEKGIAQEKRNELKPAFDAFNTARQLDPSNPEILKRFAALLSRLGKGQDAFIAYKKALDLAPEDAEILNNFGGLLLENRQFEEAIPFLKKSTETNSNQRSAYVNLGMVYEQIGDIHLAKEAYGKVEAHLSDDDLFKLHIETLCPIISMDADEIETYRKKAMKSLNKYDQVVPSSLTPEELFHGSAFPSFNLSYQGFNIKGINSRWGEFYAKRIKPVTLGTKNQKPKLAFLVTHGHEGVFMKGGCGLIKKMSSEKFDLMVLMNGEESRQRIKNFIGRENIAYQTFSKDLKLAVQEIAALNLDFLYYWEVGSDMLNYFLPFYQLARVQISSWGSPFTSGNPRIQYYWTSRWVENQNYKDHYSEEVVLFDPLVYSYDRIQKPNVVKTREHFGFPEDRKIYLCIQLINKIHPDFDPLLKGILEKDNKAVVALITPKNEAILNRLRKRFETTIGPYSNRILFLPKVPFEEYPQRVALADVCIDTPHYAGVNTTYETLQMGTPVVTLSGEFQRGKYSEAIYRIVGLEKFIAKNDKEYIDLSVRLANDPELKKELMNQFEENENRLFEQFEIVEKVETFLLEKHADQNGELDHKQKNNSATEWLEKGIEHKKRHDLKAAFDALNTARQLEASNPRILKEFADLLADLGNSRDAHIAYQKALDLAPHDPGILNDFGGFLLENQELEEALPLLIKSAEIDPNQQSAFVNLGMAYESLGDASAAKNTYGKVASRLVDGDLLKLHIETLCPNIAQSLDDIDVYRSSVAKALGHYDKLVPLTLSTQKIDQTGAFPPFSFTYQGKNVKEIKSLWGEFYAKRIKPVTLGEKNNKPKIGFLVTQSHEGVFMKDVGGILKNLSCEKFDIVVLANSEQSVNDLRAYINREEIDYCSFSRNLEIAVKEITTLNLDFLYYWEIGSDSLNYFLSYFQLARIQISSWGSAFTSGNPRVQYYWSSEWLENKEYLNHYSEEVILLKNLPTYYYRIAEPNQIKTRADFGLSNDQNIYLCVQSLSKIHPDFDILIKGILEADEKAIICLTTPKQEALVGQILSRFKRTLGSQADRVKVLKKFPHQEYLQLIKVADVCLDPPHYSGANTTYETLQMGVPVVTLPGEFQRGKYTEAIYRMLKLEDYLPKSNKDYVRLAVDLANTPKLRAQLFKAYQERANLLFEQKGLIDEIEALLSAQFDELH